MTDAELTRAAAQKVMGWELDPEPGFAYLDPVEKCLYRVGEWDCVNNIADAWMLVDKLSDRFWFSIRTPFSEADDLFWAGLTPINTTGWNGLHDYLGKADTAPRAITLACLRAVGVDVEGK